MLINFYNLILFIINFQKIKSDDTNHSLKLKKDNLEKEKQKINLKKSSDRILKYNVKNNFYTTSFLKSSNNTQNETVSKFREMKRFFDEQKYDKHYESLLYFITACSSKENYDLKKTINEHKLIEMTYLTIVKFMDEKQMKEDKFLIKLIDDLYEKYKISLKELQLVKSRFFNIKSVEQRTKFQKASNKEIQLKLRIEDLHKISNLFTVEENKKIIKELITNNDIRGNLRIKPFLRDFMGAEVEYWCLYDKIRTQINSNDSTIILTKVENCIKKYVNVKRCFFEFKDAYLKRPRKNNQNFILSDKKDSIFITQYLDLKKLFKEIENIFCRFKYNPEKEYIHLFNTFIKNRTKFLDFCCNMNFKDFQFHQSIVSDIDNFYENFKEIKCKYDIMFGQKYKKNNNQAFDIILRRPLPLGIN